jgi:peptidoglycan/xylan/chitin deacetylase (PgdA/CDA1 family)
MNATARRTLDVVLAGSPAQPFFRRRTGGQLSVLAYHGVDDPERFSAHMDHVRRTMHPVSLDEVVGAIRGSRSLPRDPVLVTFDDGHRSVADAAMPILRDRGIPAVAFVIAGVVDTDDPFWFVEVPELVELGGAAPGYAAMDGRDLVRALKRVPDRDRLAAIEALRRTSARPVRTPQLTSGDLLALRSAGIEIGNHTVSHPCLPRCDEAEVRAQIDGAQRRLGEILGSAPISFAYPNGDVDAVARALVREAGIEIAFLFDHRKVRLSAVDPLAVSRLRTDADSEMARFTTIVSGLHPAIHHARGRP